MRKATHTLLAASTGLAALAAADLPPKISAAEYRDKVYASWPSRCVGDIYGLPHENRYLARAIRIAGDTSAGSGRFARYTSITELGAYRPLADCKSLPRRPAARP